MAHEHQFPWHISLIIGRSDSENIRYCGGSLLSQHFVLTAASCLQSAVSVRVNMGSIKFLEPAISQDSTQFISHPQFNAGYNHNNIGIIRLSTPVGDYSNTLRAILIPGPAHSDNLYVNEPAFISGYGVYETGSQYLSNSLRFGRQITITNQECQQTFQPQFVPASSICVKPETNQATCYGDLGGPLVVQYNDTWMQIGIASMIHSSGCQGAVVYTRLTSYIDWIQAMTGIRNDDA